MVVVDRLSKYAHFIPLKHPFSALTVADAFIRNVVKLHGIPVSIVSDRDKVFISSFWKSLFQLQGTKLLFSSSYHPQTDGQTKVVNQTLEQYLRCFTSDQPKRWMEWLPWAEFSYNTATHLATNITPFQAVYGVPPPSLLSYVPGTTNVQAVDELLRSREDILCELRKNLIAAQSRMKSQADQHLRDPYRQSSVAFRSSLKLAPCYFGPYKVLARIDMVAYKLELHVGSQIHDVFHVSLLKKRIGTGVLVGIVILPMSEDSKLVPQPAAVLDKRIIQKGKYRPKTEILVQWEGAPREDATWENLWRFSKAYPEFVLEDKVPLRGMD
ncbi:hypothetical protein ACOSQ2_006421 [Xanthoceras sorbifolium]